MRLRALRRIARSPSAEKARFQRDLASRRRHSVSHRMAKDDLVTAAARFRAFLRERHVANAQEPPRYADQQGAFVESSIERLFGEALPIVPDANILRGTIGRACRDGQRTVLGNGAHAGLFRLFCAEHVVTEVEEYNDQWAHELGFPADAYRNAWRIHFLPYVRVVRTGDLPGLLLPTESERIDRLRAIDPDDIPSVMLALCLGGLFVSEDTDAHLATYGYATTATERRAWLEPLMAGGDAGELYKVIASASVIPALAMWSVWCVGRWLYDRSPWLLGLSVGGLSLAAARYIKPEEYRSALHALGDVGGDLVEGVFQPYHMTTQRVDEALPPFPDWDELIDQAGRDAALSRACLYTMARVRPCPITVGEISRALPRLGIGQSVQRIGKVLHNNEAFHEPYKNEWQVGCAAITGPKWVASG